MSAVDWWLVCGLSTSSQLIRLSLNRTFGTGRVDGAGASRGHVQPRGEGLSSMDALGAVVSPAARRPLLNGRQQSGQ